MGYTGIDNQKISSWANTFCDRIFSPFGDRIHIANVKDQLSTKGSITVWFSINDELQQFNNQTYQGYLRTISAYEDSKSHEQFLIIDLTVALDGVLPKEFYVGLSKRINSHHREYGLSSLSFSPLTVHADKYAFECSYLERCDFFNGQPAYVNRLLIGYKGLNTLLSKSPASTDECYDAIEQFCRDILNIGDYLRRHYLGNLITYAKEKGYEDFVSI